MNFSSGGIIQVIAGIFERQRNNVMRCECTWIKQSTFINTLGLRCHELFAVWRVMNVRFTQSNALIKVFLGGGCR